MFPTKMTKSEKYIKDILEGKIYHGKLVLRSIENFVNDLQTNTKWVYRDDIADKFIKFIECLVFTEGIKKGQRINLEPWQCFFISQIFGWVLKEDETKRRYVETTLCIPRKSGKTTLVGVISLACAYIDNEARGQVYMAATSQKQSRLCFDSAWYAVKETPGLSSRIKVSAHNLLVKKNNTYIKYISSEAGGIEGTNPSVVVLDEHHLQKDNELRDALRLGMGSRKNPLFISISTAGSDKNGPYFQHLKTCKKIVNNLIENDRHFVLIYEPDEGSDWEDIKTWKTANPNWGVSIDPELFEQDYIEAKNDLSKQVGFMTKRLNIWADSSKTWIDSKKWSSLGRNLSLEDYKGQEAYIGIDLGSTGDFSAMAILIPQADNTIHLLMRFYISEDMAGKRTRADQLNFKEWARQGYIKLTTGDATDYNYIKEDVLEICSILDYKPIAYDKALATLFSNNLYNDYSIQVESFSQSIGSVTGPTRQLNEWIFEGKLVHDNNPVMAWMISNVEILQDDANGNYKIHKGKSKNKVDGPCAAVNAIGRYMELMTSDNVITNYIKI